MTVVQLDSFDNAVYRRMLCDLIEERSPRSRSRKIGALQFWNRGASSLKLLPGFPPPIPASSLLLPPLVGSATRGSGGRSLTCRFSSQHLDAGCAPVVSAMLRMLGTKRKGGGARVPDNPKGKSTDSTWKIISSIFQHLYCSCTSALDLRPPSSRTSIDGWRNFKIPVVLPREEIG